MSQHRKNRRKLANLVLAPDKQARQALMYFGFAVVGALLVNFLLAASMQQAVTGALVASGVQPQVIAAAIEGPIQEMVWRALLLFPFLGLAALFYALRTTHRYLGPQVAIRRHIDALVAGDYSSSCRVRSTDELQEIAAQLNELAATLAERHDGADEPSDGRADERAA